jgi:PTS system galactitol-specific IIC component
MEVIQGILDFITGAGPSVMMPVIITILGVAFGVKLGRALLAGLTVGVGFIGLNLVVGLIWGGIAGVATELVETYGFSLSAVDIGWPVAASFAWTTPITIPVVAAIIITNVVMLALGWTKTMDVDIWNYWAALFPAAILYLVTGSVILAVISAVINMALIFIIADWTAPRINQYFGFEGVSLPHIFTTAWAVITIPLDKLIDRIPGLNKIRLTPEGIQEKLGPIGQPVFIGLFMGGILAAAARMDLKTILTTGMALGGGMVLLPRMVALLMEGLVPFSEGVRAFFDRRFKGREVYIGLDSAIIVGYPAVLTTGLLMVPVTLILAIILPGNRTLPLADLAALPFVVAWAVIPSGGNLFRGVLISTLYMIPILYTATWIAPLMTDLGVTYSGFTVPEGATLITSMVAAWDGYVWITHALMMAVHSLLPWL